MRKPLRVDDLITALKAAAQATGEKEFVVVGASALLGTVPDAPAQLTYTEDVDLFPENQTGFDMEKVDSLIGEGSQFQALNEFYVQRVGEWTVMDQPQGWRERSTVLEVAGIKATCLGPLDLAYNKLNAGREKDISFVAALLTHQIITPLELKEFVKAGSPHYRLDENLARFERALAASLKIANEGNGPGSVK